MKPDDLEDDVEPPEGDAWFTATKKPVEIEARGPYTDPTVVETIEGDFEVTESYVEQHDGYYIIRGVQGELYPCGADIFHETYDIGTYDATIEDAAENIEDAIESLNETMRAASTHVSHDEIRPSAKKAFDNAQEALKTLIDAHPNYVQEEPNDDD